MKRLFLAFFVAGSLVACDNSGDATKDIKDSLDSTKDERVESVKDASNEAVNTIEKEHDSLVKKIDSASQRLDSANKTQ